MWVALCFLSAIETVLAQPGTDNGDEFSNNLFSDLAPLLALFGESVAKQYLSQSMHWLDNVIFACAPLGILTAITSAIRVGGSGELKAIIGRAREPLAEAEIELMSSTSQDVCELWNGVALVRVAGSPDIVQIAYDEDANIFSSEHFNPMYINPNHERRLSPRDFHSEVRAPNISLNTRGAGHRSLCELSIVAAIGVVLQTGVLVFHAVITYRLGWGKGNYKAAPYSYPITAMGTLLLGAGVYICAFVIDSSTHEETRVLKDGFGKEITNTQIVWIQRGQKVSDQRFNSYAIYAAKGHGRVYTSYPVGTKDRKRLELWTYLGVLLSVPGLFGIGFVLQFVGLRASHFSVAISQLIAIGIMVVLRATIRRDLMVGPKLATDEYPEDRSETSSVRKLPDEYPLEYMAKSIAKARSWKIICNPTDGFYHPSTIPEFNSGSINQAARAVTVWRELKRISGDAWHPESAAVHRVTKALGEAMARTMNHVFSSNGSVSVIPSKSDISSFDCEFKILTDPDSGRYDTIRLNLLTRDKTDGKWNNWRANGFEPLLYLWVHQLRHENVPSNGQSIWLLGPGDDEVMAEILSTWWISREGSCFLVNDLQQTVRELGINKSMVINCPGTESTRFPRQGVLQMSDLEEVCGQYIFHTFFRSLVKIFSPIAGGNTKPQFSIRRAIPTPMILANDDVGELVELIRHPDLMSLDGAYRTVVLALFEVGSLPWWDALDPDCLTKIVESLNKEPLSLQEEARKQILYMCKKRAKELMRLKSFEKAGKIYSAAMLSFEKSRWFSSVSQLSEQLDELALSLNGDMVNKYQSRINSLNQSVGPFPLHNAVREGSVQDVCFQISLRTRVTDKSTLEVIDNAKMSMTPLALAAWHGFSDVVAVLLLYGADGSTALHHAAETGFDDMVPQLLRNGVNPNSYNPRGWAALHLAVDRRNQKMIELLIENGANIEKETDRDGNTALTLAILKGYENMVRLLLEKGADMERVGAEESPLLLASNTGHEGIFRLLLSYGANVQRVDGEGMTVLHRACVHKAGNIVKLLLGGKHSDHLKDSIDNKRRTPLELTVADNNLPIIRLLLRGARTGSHLDKVKRSLMVACAQGFDETVRLLVDHGAQVNSREMDGRTPLYFAVVHGRESTLRLLLDAGADANAPESSSGLTAMELARMFNNEGVIRILENRV